MNKIIIAVLFSTFSLTSFAMAQTSVLQKVESITEIKNNEELKDAYEALSSAVKELEKKNETEKLFQKAQSQTNNIGQKAFNQRRS